MTSLLLLPVLLLSSQGDFAAKTQKEGKNHKGPLLSMNAIETSIGFQELSKIKDNGSELRIKLLKSPGLNEYLASPGGMVGFHALAQSFDKFPKDPQLAFKLYAEALPKINHLTGWDAYQTTDLARTAKKLVDPKLAERVRAESAELVKRTIKKNDFQTPAFGDFKVVEFFKLDLAHLTGPGMRGELLNRPAPPFEFSWCSDPKVKTLADLRGKVVVLDFWATWCKPCIALFPKIREIRDSFAGKPVVFLGVTSLQGFVMDPKAGKIDCKGKTDKEISLMPDVMKQLGVTWEVAFSTKDCFDPGFDIMSIPHLAVIDQKGVLRYDAIDLDDLKAKVTGLLTR